MSNVSDPGGTGRYPRFGIEEEFFLLDPADGRNIPVAASVIESLPPGSRARAKPEFLASQLEHATTICESAAQARQQLLEFRVDLATAARAAGAVAAGVGTPFRVDEPPVLAAGTRYAELAARHATLIGGHQLAALHVHVEVPDPEAGVAALRCLAGWLPFLKTITGNSPWWGGHDTGFASWRAVQLRRWTTGGCPPPVTSADEYATRAAALVGIGGTRDIATVAWDVRLSPRYPTVELRVADSQLTADDALLIALIARGLVSAAITRPNEVPPFDPELIDAACWHAARFGLADGVVAPGGSALVSISDAIRHLMETLDCSDDELHHVDRGIHRLLESGTGAERQRAAAGGGWNTLGPYLAAALVADRVVDTVVH